MGLSLQQIQVQKREPISNVGNLRRESYCRSYSFWKMDLSGLILDSWLVREWVIERKRSGLPIGACFYSFHSYFPSLVLVFCFSLFFLLVFLCFPSPSFLCRCYCLLYTSMAFACHDRIYHFYPLIAFGLLWVSFSDCPLFCQLSNHHYYNVLAVPHLLPEKSGFVLFFTSLDTPIRKRARLLPYQTL